MLIRALILLVLFASNAMAQYNYIPPGLTERIDHAIQQGHARWHPMPETPETIEFLNKKTQLALGPFFRGVSGAYVPPTTVTGCTTSATGVLTTGNTATIVCAFSANVSVSGSPVLNLTATPTSSATYVTTSGANVSFLYTVVSGQTTSGANLATAATNAITGGSIVNATTGFAATLSGANNIIFTGLQVYTGTSACTRNYYLSTDSGASDNNTGLAPTFTSGTNGPWLTGTKFNSGPSGGYHPGDCVYFKGGQSWSQGGAGFALTSSTNVSSSSATNVITVSGGAVVGYGTGNAALTCTGAGSTTAKPSCFTIDGSGAALNGVVWQNITLRHSGGTWPYGLGLQSSGGATSGTFTVQNSDISGFQCPSSGCNGGQFTAAEILLQGVPGNCGALDTINILGNTLHGASITSNDDEGVGSVGCKNMTNINALGNTIYNMGSWGGGYSATGGELGFTSTSNVRAAFNLIYNNGNNLSPPSVGGGSICGIESGDGSNFVFEYNEVDNTASVNSGVPDLDGIDCDFGTLNCTVRYNHMVGNQGAGLLAFIYQDFQTTWGPANYYFNILENNGSPGSQLTGIATQGGGAPGAVLNAFNNIVYQTTAREPPLSIGVGYNATSGAIFNNIFAATSDGTNVTFIQCFTNPLGSQVFKANAYLNLSGSGTFQINQCGNGNGSGTGSGVYYTSLAAWQASASGRDTGATTAPPHFSGTTPAGVCQSFTPSSTVGPQPCPSAYKLTPSSTAYLGQGVSPSSLGLTNPTTDYYEATITQWNIGAYGGS